jgi:hypothetical protein
MQSAFCYTSYMVGCKCKIKWSWELWSKTLILVDGIEVPMGFRVYQLSVLVLVMNVIGLALVN